MLQALFDCNHFFVSCERLFRPELRRRPVAVLSSNDGCLVAASKEVKALKIPIGTPYFKCRELLEKSGATICSSNFDLYLDLSSRVMEVLSSEADEIEIYSIDEAFLKVSSLEQAKAIRAKILRWTGIPTSVGIAPTKTLAKVASYLAKRAEKRALLLGDESAIRECLRGLPLEEVWGIGRRLAPRLRALGIQSALELRELDETKIKRLFGVPLLKIALELRGQVAFPMECFPERKQGVISSRSFGRPVTTWEEMEEAIAYHTALAAEKIRRDGSQTSFLQVFLFTNRFNPLEAPLSRVGSGSLTYPTAFTPRLVERAKALARPLFHPGVPYKKCGVFLGSLTPLEGAQEDLFVDAQKRRREERLMHSLDEIKRERFGSKLFFLSEGIKRPWMMKREFASPRYTTSWKELLTIKL